MDEWIYCKYIYCAYNRKYYSYIIKGLVAGQFQDKLDTV